MLTNPLLLDSEQLKKREHDLDWISRIRLMPDSVQRWREVAALWMSVDPENRRQAAACVLAAEEMRSTRLNKFGSTGLVGGGGGITSSGLRIAFTMPAGMLVAIEAAELRMFGVKIFGGRQGKKNWAKFKEAFPEYLACEVF